MTARRAGRLQKATLLCGVLATCMSFAGLPGQAGAQSLQLPGDGPTGVDESQLGLRLPAARDDAQDGNLGRRRGVTVMARQREGYDALGVRQGSFILFPEAALSAGYDSNVSGGPNGDSDVYGQLTARARLVSDWSLHDLAVAAAVSERLYLDNSDASEFTYRLNARGRYDLSRGHNLNGSVSTRQEAQSRTSISEAIPTLEPTIYQASSFEAGSDNSFGRIKLNVAGRYSTFDYDDSLDVAGNPIDNDYRNYDLQEYLLGGGYEIGSGREVFASINYSQRRYDMPVTAAIRDSDGVEILVGLRSDITPLIRGRIGFGYITQDFDNPAFEDRSDIAIDVELAYLATELVTVNLSARRYTENVSNTSAAALLTTSYILGADYEFRRNIILSAAVEYSHGDYVGIPGSADLTALHLDGRWLVNRNYEVIGRLEARERQIDRPTFSGSASEAIASIGLLYRL